MDNQPQFGVRMNAESAPEMFAPNLAVPLPAEVLSVAPADDAASQIKLACSQYQHSLLRYLRQSDDSNSVQALRSAVETVLNCLPQDDSRAFWWIAGGLLDCIAAGLPAELNARKLLARIDRHMHAVAKGGAADVSAVVSEMLDFIARSNNAGARVAQIKQHYALKSDLPAPTPAQLVDVAQVLADMREQFRLAEENWEGCAIGDASAYIKFIKSVNTLAQQSEQLAPDTLQQLTRQIQAVSLQVSAPEHVRPIAMDMAMALLLLGNGIEQYAHLGDSFQEQARILCERMLATLNNRSQDTQSFDKLIGLHSRMQADVVMMPLLREILVNLQQAKQMLGDAAKRNEQSTLLRLLAQMRGGLRFLSLAQAEQLLAAMQERARLLEQAKTAPKPTEMAALSGSLDALENYLQQPSQQRESAALQTALDALAKLQHAEASPALPAEQQGAAEALPHAQDVDHELLEVFLEEAQEALQAMRDNMQLCQTNPDSNEPLAGIRRGFHTLKGSGRMVGLTDLGEVAWAVERAMNKWLRDNKAATPELLHFIGLAAEKFSGWIAALQSRGSVQVEAAELVEMAQRIEQGVTQEVVAAVPQEAPAAPEPVVIGDVKLDPVLFKISSEEAKQNVAVLQEQLAELCAAEPPAIQYDFMRAAHTLAGIARTTGFPDVVMVAHSLERWLQARMEQSFTLNDEQTQMLRETVDALQEMVAQICARQMPSPHGKLVGQLLANKDKLREEESLAQAIGNALTAMQQAAPATVFGKTDKPQVRDDVDEQLLPVFLEEADDLLPKIGAALRAWRESPHDTQQSDLLKRLLHTLKGSARMAGAMRIGEIGHEMEDRVLAAAKMQDQAGYWNELEDDFDRIGGMIEGLRIGEIAKSAAVEEEATQPAKVEAHVERATPEVAAANMLRVRADVVDRLVNEAGEISVARSRMEAEMNAFKEGLLELTGSVMRLREQLREVEMQAESQMQARVRLAKEDAEHFDPLEFDRFTRLQELTRAMHESVHDVQTVQQSLLGNMDEAAAAMSAQARLNRELHQGLMNVRMVPFASISERLYRIVRQTGKELGKRANLELQGAEVELDRSVLEKMTAPFEHLLRNAVAHGMESEAQRQRSGKALIGEIRLYVRQENNEVVFEFSDDGAGLNYAALREKAIAKGLLQADEAADNAQLAQLIFASGISTASEVTEVAGRGIGMDVVRSEIAGLGGRIEVHSESGRGTQFIIHLPLTLAVTQVLMVRSGDDIYAIPAATIEQVRQVKQAEMDNLYREGKAVWQGKNYPLHYLPRLLGDAERVAENRPHNALLLLRGGEQGIALHVDELLGNREAVVKNTGPQLARLPGIAGATVTGNGAVVLILNPVQLAQRMAAAPLQATPAAPVKLRRQPLVMVVDDSLTVRKISTRLLTRAGYQVVTAKDGLDALEQLDDISPDVMLLDIEMPRMDGFELTRQLREDPKTRDLPIIIITSRIAEKHRNYAQELGVSAYLGKPYQEEDLLQRIAAIVAAR
jgi:chemosensory pili system protein ChpA (sensor histidine kinase/response regulator)